MDSFFGTTLVENCVYHRKLQAEHGLSIYIRTPEYRLLFDTGQSGLLLHNAKLLHIDLQAVDFLVLSHGHSDHTGGLHAFLAHNQKAVVYCKPEILRRKFKKSRENGLTDIDRLDFSRFHFLTEVTEICPGVTLSPHIPITYPEDTHYASFFTEVNGERVPDMFEDELIMYLTDTDTFSVVSACSHRGITNMIEQGRSLFPNRQLNAVIGGFHIHTAGAEPCAVITDYFRRNTPQSIGVCHCTGVDQFAAIKERYPQITYYNYVGNTFQI